MAEVHTLKTATRYWKAVARGDKTFEVRLNDRAFQTGDFVDLVRTDDAGIRMLDEPPIRRRITYILQGGQFGIEPRYCVLGLGEVEEPVMAEKCNDTPQAWLDVIAERKRQVSVEGWHTEHDAVHSSGELSSAAAAYALSAAQSCGTCTPEPACIWPWGYDYWKPTNTRRDLVKAGALILAEIERLDRAEAKKGGADADRV